LNASCDDSSDVFIERLRDRSLPDADQESCIEAIEVLLEVEAVGLMVEVMKDSSRSLSVRKAAAAALHTLASDVEKDDLRLKMRQYPPELRELCQIAIFGIDDSE